MRRTTDAVTPRPGPVLALDIGGANLKVADGRGFSHAEPFPLWRQPEALGPRLVEFVRERRPARVVATMTGEIADCFASRREGVEAIVAAVVAAAREVAAGVEILRVDGRLVPPAAAVAEPLAVAAANWQALARLAAAHAPAWPAVLLDVGSTTTDIIPLDQGQPTPAATDDAGRLAAGELVYTGIERTPIAALLRRFVHRGVARPVVAERYADARDAWLWLGELAEDPAATDTADGRPLTRDAARARLARMLLVEGESFTAADATALAARCGRVQVRQVVRGLRRVATALGRPPAGLVLSGHGECLARRAIVRWGWDGPVVSLSSRLGPAVARVAPAHGLALIALGDLP
ncbi:MAG: H4MPT-linked C1 transfer pathway protein [Planctomycetia bacterium]|nr:H4MPT-linked C1 transfer pathway protein [Planctomycetia bacterium]